MPIISQSRFYMPFESSPTLTQGIGGSTSHMGRLNFSLDFGVGVGTNINPIGHGIVVEVSDKASDFGGPTYNNITGNIIAPSTTLGPGQLGNFVTVMHQYQGDENEIVEFYATYAHLNPGVSNSITVGDIVDPTDSLGVVAWTGAMTGPHLHVHFGTSLRNVSDDWIASAVDSESAFDNFSFNIVTSFDGDGNPIFEPANFSNDDAGNTIPNQDLANLLEFLVRDENGTPVTAVSANRVGARA